MEAITRATESRQLQSENNAFAADSSQGDWPHALGCPRMQLT